MRVRALRHVRNRLSGKGSGLSQPGYGYDREISWSERQGNGLVSERGRLVTYRNRLSCVCVLTRTSGHVITQGGGVMRPRIGYK